MLVSEIKFKALFLSIEHAKAKFQREFPLVINEILLFDSTERFDVINKLNYCVLELFVLKLMCK